MNTTKHAKDAPDYPDDPAQTGMEFLFTKAGLFMQIWYGMLYVVVEGWRELGLVDDEIDALSKNSEYVTKLRNFRNAVFHYQKRLPLKQEGLFAELPMLLWLTDLSEAFQRRLLVDEGREREAMSKMTNPHDALVSFQKEFKLGRIRVKAAPTNPEIFIHVDFPDGNPRFAYVTLEGKTVTAFVALAEIEKIDGVQCIQVGWAVPEKFRGKCRAKELVKAALADLKIGVVNEMPTFPTLHLQGPSCWRRR